MSLKFLYLIGNSLFLIALKTLINCRLVRDSEEHDMNKSNIINCQKNKQAKSILLTDLSEMK